LKSKTGKGGDLARFEKLTHFDVGQAVNLDGTIGDISGASYY